MPTEIRGSVLDVTLPLRTAERTEVTGSVNQGKLGSPPSRLSGESVWIKRAGSGWQMLRLWRTVPVGARYTIKRTGAKLRLLARRD